MSSTTKKLFTSIVLGWRQKSQQIKPPTWPDRPTTSRKLQFGRTYPLRFCMFWVLQQRICLLCMWLWVCIVQVRSLPLLLQYGAMAAAAGRQAGNDEVIQQAGLRPWQLALRPVPVLTGAVVQWAWRFGPSSTPALPHCCFFISLGTGPGHCAACQAHSVNPQLLQGFRASSLRPTRSLLVSVCGHTLWLQSSQGIEDRVTYQHTR